MLRRLLIVCLSVLTQSAKAQPADEALRRQFVEERRQIELRYQAAIRECADRFAVTACQDEARAERRKALAVVRKQELDLDDRERMRRAEVRREAIEQKKRLAAQSAASAPVIRSRAARPPMVASAPPPAAAAASGPPPLDGDAAAVARRAEQSAARQRELAARQRAIDERQKLRQDRAASNPQSAAPLPTPR